VKESAVIKRVRLDPEARSKSKSVTSARAPRWTLFGQPPLLDGEDAAAYDELLARFCAAVKPVDIIDEMFITDVASLEWDVLRLRRLKSSLIRARGLELLEEFFNEKTRLQSVLGGLCRRSCGNSSGQSSGRPGERCADAARKCAQDEADAVDKVNEVLDGIELDMDKVLDDVRARKAKELVQEYARREPDAVTLVHKLLTEAA
jgi:hypothetical protein